MNSPARSRIFPDRTAAPASPRRLEAGRPPRPGIEPIRVQRRISATGVTVVAGQKLILG